MKKLILVITLIFLLSCTKKSSNEIILFDTIAFQMHKGETLMGIKPSINELYSAYFNNRQPQIPLFKYVKHLNYQIFIGIPYDTSISNMIKAQLEKPDSLRVFFESNPNYFFTKYERDGLYITEYASVYENRNILYISTITNMKEISDSLFNMSDVSTRIKLKRN